MTFNGFNAGFNDAFNGSLIEVHWFQWLVSMKFNETQ
tara:strand:+ start:256 stop:366 length:111 start_codon:yes stop_codon:yes gene_type:complete